MKSIAIVVGCIVLALGHLSAQTSDEDRRYRLAQGYEESGDLKNAARVYKELYDLDPQSNAYFEGVRRTYTALLRYADLLPIVESRLASREDDIELRTFYAALLHRNNRRDEADEQWRKAIEMRPDDALTYHYVAQSQIELRLFDRAVDVYKAGRSRLGGAETFADQLAQLYGILGRYREASEEYLTLLAGSPERLGFVMSGLGVFTVNPDGAKAAIEATQKRSDRRPDYLPYLELLSWLYTERGDYDGSFEIAKRIDDHRHANGSNIYAFADRAYRTGQYDAAIKAFEYFIDTYSTSNPLYPSVVFNYTRALEDRYRQRGAPSDDEASKLVDRYRQFVDQQKNSPIAAEALLQIAQLQADDLNRPEKALETLGELRAMPGGRYAALPEALLLEGDLQLRIGNVARAQEIYRSGRTTIVRGAEGDRYRDLAALRYAETLFYLGEFKEAVDAFTELTKNTASESTNDALGYLFILQENFEKNDDALKHYASGQLALVQHRWDDAIEAMDSVMALGAKTSLADDALMGKARAQESTGKNGDAVGTLMSIVRDYSDGTVADRALFHAAEITESKLNDRAKAIELYTRVLTEYPSSIFASTARQRIRLLRGDS